MMTQPSPRGGLPVSPRLGATRNDSGAALLVTVLILLVVSILGTTVVNMGRVDYALSSNYRSSVSALSLADSGLQAAAADLRADYYADPADNWLVDWLNMGTTPPSVPTPFPDASGTDVNGFTLRTASLSPSPYPGVAYDLGGASTLGSGNFARTIWLPPTVVMDNGSPVVTIRIRSTGSDGNVATPANATIDGVITIDLNDSNPYGAGAFLGRGDGRNLIRGGAVRIAGTVVAIGDPPRQRRRRRRPLGGSRLNLMNGSSIVNNYEGIDDASALSSLSTKLPALDTLDVNGEDVEDLGAALHLKDVTTLMSRSGGQLGEPDTAGDGYKETLDGVYTDDPIIPYAGNVHADTISSSDLADDLLFPSLSSPYTDPGSGTTYLSFADYLNSTSYQPITGGDMIISSATPAFALVDPAGRGAMSWDPSTETLTIDGIVKITGTVSFGDRNLRSGDSLAAINYQGTGVLWATEDIEITKDIYPARSYLQDGPDLDSDVDGNLGLIASDEIIVNGNSRARSRPRRGATSDANIQILAAVFAENRLRVQSQANIAGSVVTNAINVSRRASLGIWHVPSLAAMAPNGMPVGAVAVDIKVAIGEWFQRR